MPWEKIIQTAKQQDDSKDGTGYAVNFYFSGAELRAFVRISGDESDVAAADFLQPAELDALRTSLEAARDHVCATLGYNKVP